MKVIKKLLKNFVFSTITIYSLNIILVKIGYYVPINYFSLIITSILGFPGLIYMEYLPINFIGDEYEQRSNY